MFVLLKLTFSLPLCPPLFVPVLPSKAECSPTNAFLHLIASVDRLSLFIFRARALVVSYYALVDEPPDCLYTPNSSLSSHLGAHLGALVGDVGG